MGRIVTLCAILAVFSSLALAETWNGRLIDANCYDQQTDQKNVGACDPTSSTSSFGLFVSGKIFKLDEQGNTKAAAAIKDRADRTTDPSKPESGVSAKVTGSMDGDSKLKVDKIEVQ